MSPRSLHFAHVTDVHVSEQEQSWGAVSALTLLFLRKCFARLNALNNLDFVLITGDVLDLASPGELDQFRAALATLRKPWHFTPGNHDGFYDPQHPHAYEPHEAVALIDPRMASPEPHAQQAYWSRTVTPGIQLIGLDSRIPDDWAGEISPAQLEWLRAELDDHRDDWVILATHHPLHDLGPHNRREWRSKFICSNGKEVESLLDQYPGVKLVIGGHHHANQIRQRGHRLHVSTAALGGYPCVYRTIRLAEQDGKAHLHVETHTVADEAALKLSYDVLRDSQIARVFDEGNPDAWMSLVEGKPEDQSFDGFLT